ncbi:MAG: hypothetical protein SGI90_05390 [Candidatus Eisenbacteria bacterium]|nr:hypothetical protein [Candidatus Eisenbacteria bacterium]
MRLIHLDQMRGYEDFRTLILDESWSWDLAARFVASTADAIRPFDSDPGAAAVLSVLVRILGSQPELILAALAVTGALAAVVIQLLGIRVLGGAAGFACGLIAAGYRPAIHHGGHLLDAAFLPILAALALLLASVLISARKPLPEVLLGIAAGSTTAFLALFQAPLILLAPVLLVILIFDRKMKPARQIRRGASFTVGVLVMLAGISCIQTPNAGPRLLLPPIIGREFNLANRDGNRAGLRLPPPWAPSDPAGLAEAYRTEGARQVGAANVGALAVDQAWFDMSGREAAENPWGFLHGWAWRAFRLINAGETPGPLDLAFETGRSWILRLPFPGWAILFPLAVVGGLATRRDTKRPAMGLSTGWFLIVLLAASPFAISSRVRMAAEPALILLAVSGAMSIASMLRKRDGRALAAAALTIGILGVAIRLPAGGPGAAPFHRILSDAYAGRGAADAAEEHRLEAARLSARAMSRLGQPR